MLDYSSGHQKTVYSIVWPETEQAIKNCFQNHLDELMARHRAPHTKMQDQYGPDFARQWWNWAQISSMSADEWAEFYPTAGASEALREIINELGGGRGDLVVFDGEYEGYAAIAQGQGINVHKISRDHWKEEWDRLAPLLSSKIQWWISEPSSINGCWWDGFDDWARDVSQHPNVELWADVSYVGATVHHHERAIVPQYFAGVVFSLSKPAGVYYRRIGGCFARRPVSGLWGNRWFKNVDALFLGQHWLQSFGRGELPAKYAAVQYQVIAHWNGSEAKSLWVPSDVVLLAHAASRPHTENDDRHARGSFYRVCLSPAIHDLIGGQVT